MLIIVFNGMKQLFKNAQHYHFKTGGEEYCIRLVEITVEIQIGRISFSLVYLSNQWYLQSSYQPYISNTLSFLRRIMDNNNKVLCFISYQCHSELFNVS